MRYTDEQSAKWIYAPDWQVSSLHGYAMLYDTNGGELIQLPDHWLVDYAVNDRWVGR